MDSYKTDEIGNSNSTIETLFDQQNDSNIKNSVTQFLISQMEELSRIENIRVQKSILETIFGTLEKYEEQISKKICLSTCFLDFMMNLLPTLSVTNAEYIYSLLLFFLKDRNVIHEFIKVEYFNILVDCLDNQLFTENSESMIFKILFVFIDNFLKESFDVNNKSNDSSDTSVIDEIFLRLIEINIEKIKVEHQIYLLCPLAKYCDEEQARSLSKYVTRITPLPYGKILTNLAFFAYYLVNNYFENYLLTMDHPDLDSYNANIFFKLIDGFKELSEKNDLENQDLTDDKGEIQPKEEEEENHKFQMSFLQFLILLIDNYDKIHEVDRSILRNSINANSILKLALNNPNNSIEVFGMRLLLKISSISESFIFDDDQQICLLLKKALIDDHSHRSRVYAIQLQRYCLQNMSYTSIIPFTDEDFIYSFCEMSETQMTPFYVLLDFIVQLMQSISFSSDLQYKVLSILNETDFLENLDLENELIDGLESSKYQLYIQELTEAISSVENDHSRT